MRLPSAYQEVEYIESSRTQVIDTGVVPTTQTYTAELEVESTQSGVEYWAFGIWGTTGFRGGQDSSGHWDTSYGASYEPSSYNLNTKTKITMSNAGKGTSSNTAIGLFGMGENGAYSNDRKGAYKIYYCKIWNNGTLIRDFVPCYRKSNDEIGMYDTVNNTFYTNSGTGTFTKGANVEYPPEYKLHGAIQTFHREYEYIPQPYTSAYYPLTDNANDYSQNGNNGVAGSGVSFTSSGNLKYASFDGTSNGKISLPQFGTTSVLTTSIWVNSTVTGTGKIFWGLSSSNNDSNLYFSIENGNVALTMWNGSSDDRVTGTTINDGDWHNIIGIFNNGELKLYVDGEYIGNTSTSVSVLNNNNGAIGGWVSGNGVVCNLSENIIENKIRTVGDIKRYYNRRKDRYETPSREPGENTVAYYPLNSTTTVNDMSGNNYTLTNNGTSFGTYDGVDCAYLPMANSNRLYRDLPMTGNNPFTVNLYAQRTTYGSNTQFAYFFTFGDLLTAGRNFSCGMATTSANFVLATWGTTKYFGEYSYNNWYMATITNDNGSVKVYINGIKLLDDTLSFNVASEHFAIGSAYQGNNSGNYQAFMGYISEFIIENRVWTQEEITRYYNKTKGTYGLS